MTAVIFTKKGFLTFLIDDIVVTLHKFHYKTYHFQVTANHHENYTFQIPCLRHGYRHGMDNNADVGSGNTCLQKFICSH